jgi:small subunit ribosomal protein S16
MDSRSARNSRSIEDLGFYDPMTPHEAAAIRFDLERVIYWLEKGAQPNETVQGLLKKIGVEPKPGKPVLSEDAQATLEAQKAAKQAAKAAALQSHDKQAEAEAAADAEHAREMAEEQTQA